MASYVVPKKGVEFIFYVGLDSVATAGAFQANPTLASGDFKVSTDGGSLANLTTLPTVTPASGKMVKITLSTSEMNGDNITVVCSDASGGEWKDLIINIQTAARQIDDLAYPTTSGRSIDVTTTGEVGIDWANIGSPTTSVNLSGTTVKTATDVETDTADIQSRLPAALVSGRIDSSVGAMASGVITATAIASDAITAAKIADGAIDAATFAAGAINAAAIATDAIDADALAADAVTELQNGLLTTSAFNTKLGTPAGASVSADIAAVKAETSSIQSDTNDLQTQIGTAGAGLTAVASAANLATLTGYVDTEVAAIKAKTDNLPAAPAATGDIPSANSIASAVWGFVTAGGYTATQVLRLMVSVLAGKSSGGGTTTVVFRDLDDTRDRIVATVDADGNRTAVVRDAT